MYFPSSAEIARTIVTFQDFVKPLSIALGSTPIIQNCPDYHTVNGNPLSIIYWSYDLEL